MLPEKQSILGENHCKHTTVSGSASLEMSVVPIRAGQSPVWCICNVEIIESTQAKLRFMLSMFHCDRATVWTEQQLCARFIQLRKVLVSFCILCFWVFLFNAVCLFWYFRINPTYFEIWQMCEKLLYINNFINTCGWEVSRTFVLRLFCQKSSSRSWIEFVFPLINRLVDRWAETWSVMI